MKGRVIDLEPPAPIYYMGWVIQPSWEGDFWVISREDTRRAPEKKFCSSEDALIYIGEQISEGK